MKEEGFRPLGDRTSLCRSHRRGGDTRHKFERKTLAEEKETLPKLQSLLTELIATTLFGELITVGIPSPSS